MFPGVGHGDRYKDHPRRNWFEWREGKVFIRTMKIIYIQIQCRKVQMKDYHVNKYMVEQSSTVP